MESIDNNGNSLIVIEDYMDNFRPENCIGTVNECRLPAGKVIIPYLEDKLSEIYSYGDEFGVYIENLHLNNLIFNVKLDDNNFKRICILFNGINSLEIVENYYQRVSSREVFAQSRDTKYDLSLSKEAPVQDLIQEKKSSLSAKRGSEQEVSENVKAVLIRNQINAGGNLTSTNKRFLERKYVRPATSKDDHILYDHTKCGICCEMDSLDSKYDRIETTKLYNNRYVIKSVLFHDFNIPEEVTLGFIDLDSEREIKIDEGKKTVKLGQKDLPRTKLDGYDYSNLGLLLK